MMKFIALSSRNVSVLFVIASDGKEFIVYEICLSGSEWF